LPSDGLPKQQGQSIQCEPTADRQLLYNATHTSQCSYAVISNNKELNNRLTPMLWVHLQQMAVVTVKFVQMKSVPVLFWTKERPTKSVAMGAEAGFPSDQTSQSWQPGSDAGTPFLEAHEESRYFSAPRCFVCPNVPVPSQLVVSCRCPCTQSRDSLHTAIFASNDVVSLEQPSFPVPADYCTTN